MFFKCKMCGGQLSVEEGMTVCDCEYCGSKQTIPSADNEKKITLYERANRLRFNSEFDKASGVYENIIADFPEEAEAFWGLVLCRYGIEYVDDPSTGKKVPTCHRSSFDSVMDDSDFEMVMENADSISRGVYREQAKEIEEIRKGIVEISGKEEPYDIFICYKETAEDGQRTIDSMLAQDVYDALVEKGYRVFFSRITLEDKLGLEYEPYIFAALNSAKIMLAFGTNYDYYNAVWVKNEWSRFLKLMAKDREKHLIPCFKDIDAYDIPKEFARLQAQDMGKVGAIQDLVRGIGKIIGSKAISANGFTATVSAEGSALTQRGTMALEDGDFEDAEGFFERALDANPSDARAYLGKFLAFNKLTSLADLEKVVVLLDDDKAFKRAEQFADSTLASELSKVRAFNEIKKQRLRVVDVLKKHRKKAAIEYLTKKKKEAYEKLMFQTVEGESAARDIFKELSIHGIISTSTTEKLIENIYIIKEVASVLSDCELHASSIIVTEGSLSKYSERSVNSVLADLVDLGVIEQHDLGYCLIGAKEKKERILREAIERRLKEERQVAAYNVACAEINRNIQDEIAKTTLSISEEFDARIKEVQREINEEVDESNRQQDVIQREINRLKACMSSLGLFKGNEKKALQVQIDEARQRLSRIDGQQQIQSRYQPRFNQINAEKAQTIKKVSDEIRAKYTMPKYEDFIEV